jgi:hypothetical protein
MNRTVQTGASIGVVLIVFAVGFMTGRFSRPLCGYEAALSPAESPLVGHWRIASNTAPMKSAIEFRDDRTAVKFKEDGKPGIIATWGRVGDELSIQNAHVTGEERFYVPPSLFKVLKIDDRQIDLVTADGEIAWELTRTAN